MKLGPYIGLSDSGGWSASRIPRKKGWALLCFFSFASTGPCPSKRNIHICRVAPGRRRYSIYFLFIYLFIYLFIFILFFFKKTNTNILITIQTTLTFQHIFYIIDIDHVLQACLVCSLGNCMKEYPIETLSAIFYSGRVKQESFNIIS